MALETSLGIREIAAASLAVVAVIVVTAAGCANSGSTTDVGAGSCDAPFKYCNNVCVDTSADPDNCGGCGKSCKNGQICTQGKCGTSCPQGEQACTDDAGATLCVNVRNDNQHCGNCHSACGAGQFCANGACSDGCVQGQTKCVGEAGAAYCANLKTDGHNCGTCGNACGPQQVCNNGSCTSECDSDQTLCSPDAGAPSYCANLQTDNANCGACGTTCGVLEMCINGACTSACNPSQTKCLPDGGQPYCANLQSDASNCGMCGNVCPQNLPVCIGGVCSSSSGCLQGGKNPPAQCTAGNDPQTSSPYVVCSADCNQIWISCVNANGGTYHATEICNQFGYSTLAKYGGNYGDQCGYGPNKTDSCSSPGQETFSNGGSCGSDQYGQKLCVTVMWLCTK
jgi:hypothetical protein